MNGVLEWLRQHFWNQRQRDGDIAFHVRSAAAKELAVTFNHCKGVGIPWLADHGDYIGVARKRDATSDRWPDRCQQISLGLFVVEQDPGFNAVLR